MPGSQSTVFLIIGIGNATHNTIYQKHFDSSMNTSMVSPLITNKRIVNSS
jgi:hypothetical protein